MSTISQTRRFPLAATANNTVTIRIDRETHETLRRLAEQSGETMSQVAARAIERYRRESFIENANRAWKKITDQDPSAQDEYLEIQRQLEGTLNDGLEDNPW